MEWLNEQFGTQTARLLLERRGDQLRTADREQLGVARALQLEATTLLIEDDDRSRDEWVRESVELLERLMPAVPLDVVSTRPPSPFRSWVLMPSPPQQGRA